MANNNNPLIQKIPAKSECLYWGTFAPATEKGGHNTSAAFVRYRLRLTEDQLWLSRQLSIPIRCIQRTEIVKSFTGYGLKIFFLNPNNSTTEVVSICKMSSFRFWVRRRPVDQLNDKIRELKAKNPGNYIRPNRRRNRPSHGNGCEVCGAKPVTYASYTYQITFLFLSYQSGETRHRHCPRHNFRSGFWRYLLTAALGWPGIGVLSYLPALYRTSVALTPAFGTSAQIPLTLIPIISLLVILVLTVIH